MKWIYKYPLTTSAKQYVWVPAGARPLAVQAQRDLPQLWAIVDVEKPPARLELRIVKTGQGFPDADEVGPDGMAWQYISTFQLMSGELVFHAFWRTAPLTPPTPEQPT